MRCLMFLFTLVAALSATPLRQSEAADDFARSRDELAGGHTLDVADGGVGDDRAETVLVAPPRPVTTPPARLDEPSSTFALPLSLAPDRAERPPRPEPSARRQARLQRFLF